MLGATESVDELVASLEQKKQDLEHLVNSISSCISSLKASKSAENVVDGLSDSHISLAIEEKGLSSGEPDSTSLLRLADKIRTTTASLNVLRLQIDTSTHYSKQSAELPASPPAMVLEATTSQTWPLEPAEYRRYARQLVMPEIGIEGQLRLKASSVLIIGAGGLGCPAAAYLAGAGVGTIGIVDGDEVEESNLHRQIMHDSTKVGMMKVDSVIEAMKKINSLPKYVAHAAHLTPESALEILSSYDVILDCTDNPATRYLVSDACVLLSKPLVSASALRTDGQLTVLNYPAAPAGTKKTTRKVAGPNNVPQEVEVPAGGPCYRCIWPIPPPPSAVQTCGEGGILGPVVGTMGILQALETIKIIARDPAAEVLPAQMHLFSTYPSLSLRSVRLRPRRPQCASCSKNATVTKESLTSGSLDYVAFCGGLVGETDVLPIEERVLAKDFLVDGGVVEVTSSPSLGSEINKASSAAPLVIDLRERTLYDIYHLRDSVNVPYSQLSLWRSVSDISDVVKSKKSSRILLLCARGNDSQLGAMKLRSLLGEDSQITDVVGGWTSLRGFVDFPRM